MALDPIDYTPDDIGIEAGTRVKAKILGWDGRYEDGTDYAIAHDQLGFTDVDGYLDIFRVEPLGYWSFLVRGFSVDPSTIVALT